MPQQVDIPVQYARVANGEITEYPVTLQHINNRKHPISWYKECFFEKSFNVDEFHRVINKPVLKNEEVMIESTVVPFTLDEVFYNLYKKRNLLFPYGGADNRISMDDVSETEMNKIESLFHEHIENKLNKFSKKRGYDSILSAVSYSSSPVARYKSDAKKAIKLRDRTWESTFTTLTSVKEKTILFPLFTRELEDLLPTLTWA